MTGRSVKGFHIYWIFTMHTFNNCTWCKHSLHPWHKFEPTVYICTHQYEKSIICPAFTVNFFIVSFLFIHLKPHPPSSPPHSTLHSQHFPTCLKSLKTLSTLPFTFTRPSSTSLKKIFTLIHCFLKVLS